MPLPALLAKRPSRAGLEPVRPSKLPAGAKAAFATSVAIGTAEEHHLMARPQFAALALIGSARSVISLVHFRKTLGAMA